MPPSSLATLAAWQGEIQALLPKLSRSQARVIGEMVYAMLMVDGCGMTRLCSFLSYLLGQSTGTLRQKYREILYEKEAKAGVKKRGWKRREILVDEHFADLLRGVLQGWEGERTLALALDASTLSDRFDVLSISVLTRGGAIRVAWTMLESHQEGAWREHWERMLSLLGEAVPTDWQVLVMADRGLYAAWLFEAIRANGWHPLLRVNGPMTFRAEGSEAFVRSDGLVKQAGKRWKGKGEWSETGERLRGTLAIRWEKGYEEPICVVTDLEPDQVQAGWYQMRFWIETEYKDGKRGWFHWEQSKMTHPQRASRLWLLLGIALQKAILLGNSLEAREEAEYARRRRSRGAKAKRGRGRPPLGRKRPRGREQSVLMRGMMALRAAACGSGEPLPAGHLCFEALPSHLYPLHKASKSYQQKKHQKEEHHRNRQRRRERAREARQEAKRYRQQEQQAEAEAKRAARMARREEPLKRRPGGNISRRSKPCGRSGRRLRWDACQSER